MARLSLRSLSRSWDEWAWCWRRWWLYAAAAEFAGFAVPALTGIVAWRGEFAAVPFYLAMVAAGAGEGALLGVGQRRALVPVAAVGGRWVFRTSVAAGGAWGIGMLPSTLLDLSVPVWLAALIFALLAPLLLLSIGIAQWSVLRHHLPDAWLWVPANGTAWLLALPVTFIAPALLPPNASVFTQIAAWLVAGAVMAAVMAALTGLALIYLLGEANPTGRRHVDREPR